MALNFKKYEPRESSTLVDLGTVASQIPGGKISFTPGTLAKYRAGSIKSISMLLTDKSGMSVTAPLSKRASAGIFAALKNGSSKEDCLAAISKLTILETEEGGNIIAAPRGASGKEIEITLSVATPNKITFDDLVQF